MRMFFQQRHKEKTKPSTLRLRGLFVFDIGRVYEGEENIAESAGKG